jgi:2-C-methyl-D-erythritol 2,4-cyclodiphosphate synthase
MYRVGIGYDIHAFGPRRKLVLGGVTIPHKLGLVGHSDADALLHAICDALLGAASLGDIGTHFPDTSPQYKGISSLVLLERVGKLLSRKKHRIVNIDATIVLERPKVLKYSTAMTAKIAGRLRIQTGQISIKATTNEGLGFIGRGEGCAALAIASITSSRPE